MEKITSFNNTLIKKIASLSQRKYREKENAFLIEGTRIVETALKANAEFKSCFFTDNFLNHSRNEQLLNDLKKNIPCYEVSESVFEKISQTKSPQGILAVITKPCLDIKKLILPAKQNFTIAILDKMQDPGNVGTIIRTADSLGIFAVFALKGTVDIFNDKTIRSTMGSIFHLPIIEKVSIDDLSSFIKENHLHLFSSMLDEKATPIYKANFNRACGIILGNEGNGVSLELQKISDEKIFIPMEGKAESLNVSSAASIIFYEVKRQKAFN